MRKRAEDLLREADEIKRKAHDLRKLEKKRERGEERLRVGLLGALLEQRLASDPGERARVNAELKGFLKSPDHRSLFRIDEATTYIDTLPEKHAAKRAKRAEKRAARQAAAADAKPKEAGGAAGSANAASPPASSLAASGRSEQKSGSSPGDGSKPGASTAKDSGLTRAASNITPLRTSEPGAPVSSVAGAAT